MKLALLGLLCGVVFGQNLITLDTGSGGAQWNGSGPAIGTYRLELRVENAQPGNWPVSNGQGLANLNCLINSAGGFGCAQGGDGTPQGVPSSQLTSGQDVRARFQRDATGLTYTLETWNGDCTGHFKQQLTITNQGQLQPGGPWTVGPSVNLSFLRGYSSLDAAGDCPVDAPVVAADLFDFTFEGNSLKDRSANGYKMSVAGLRSGTACGNAPCFAPSATYPPQAMITGWNGSKPVFIAGTPFQLNGGNSFSSAYPGTGALSSYQWTQTNGPGSSVINPSQAAVATITAPSGGQFTFQLTVTDSLGNTASTTQTVGVVALGTTGTVMQSTSDFTWSLGTVAPFGASGWPWYDVTSTADADLLAPLMIAPPTSTPGPGTLYAPVGAGAPNVLNSQNGTIQSKQYGGVLWVGAGTNFTAADVGTRFVAIWDADGNGTNLGRRPIYIVQVIDATHIVSGDYYLPEPASVFDNPQGLSWGRLGADFNPYNSSDQNDYILNYYEAGLGVGRIYAATGLSSYQNQFHSFCDNWWRWGLGSGYSVPIPRNSGLHLAIACATDPSYNAPANMVTGIGRITQAMSGYQSTAAGNQQGYNPTSPVVRGTADVRETSYVLRPTALLARLYGHRAKAVSPWCGYLANQLKNFWIVNAAVPTAAPSSSYAYWEENLFLINPTYVAASIPAADPNGHFGTSPWRSAGLPTLALIYAYEALRDPLGCDNQALANVLFNPNDGTGLIANAANYIWDYGRSADGGVFFAEGYGSDTGDTLGWTVYNAFPQNGSIAVTQGSTAVVGNGSYFTAQFGPCDGSTRVVIQSVTYTVAGCADDTHMSLSSPYTGTTQSGLGAYSNPATVGVTNGSTQVVGSGTKFTVLYAPCDGSTFIGIQGNQNPNVDRRVYQVMSCADDRHLTVNLGYAGPTESGLNVFSRAHRVNQNCAPMSISTHCEYDRYDGRNLSSDTGASAAWLYAQTGSQSWKTRALFYANKTFGGAAGGSGALGAPTGSCIYARPGTIAISQGGTTVTGSGTQFTKQLACDGTDLLTIGDATNGYTWANFPGFEPAFYTVKVQSCPSDTSLKLASPYPGNNGSNISMFYAPNDPQWQCADGGAGNLGEILPGCNAAAPPCGIGDLVPKYGKPLGMAAGAGDAPLMFANLSAPVVTLSIPLELAGIPQAAKARVTLSGPKGVIARQICGSSPCRMVVQGTLRDATMTIEYLSAAGAILTTRQSPVPKPAGPQDQDSRKLEDCCALKKP